MKPEGSHYDILLIEDDLATIRLLTSYFESKDITCKGVVSGTKALEELEYNTPKLILTDIIHPAPSGYEICKQIKSNQILKNIPVFFCTAIPGSEVEKHLAETKADGYINKPFDFSDFDGILDLLRSNSVKEVEIQRTPLLEYKINEFLSLKLEGIFKVRTQIYVKGKRFLQCKTLVLVMSKKDIPIYDEIDSIDEVADLYRYQNEIVEGSFPLHEYQDVTPEQEFWGHCSNLQVWYENDYDTRLLHSNLAFNLLKALIEAGDPNAKRVFKTEVAKRFEIGYPNTIVSIIHANLLDHFSLEEKRELIRPNVSIVLKYAPKLLDYFSPEEKKELIQENKAIIYEIFKEIKLYREYILRSHNPITGIFEEQLFNYLTPEDQRDIIQKSFHDLLIYIEMVSKYFWFRPKIYRETLSYVCLIILKAIKGIPLMDDFLKKLAGLLPMLNLQFLNAFQELMKIDKIYWTDIFGSFMQLWGEKTAQLRIEKLEANRSGRSLCYIDPNILDNLRLSTGDIIEIIGRKKTAGIVVASLADKGKGIIRIDGIQRKNLGSNIGEIVTIKPTRASPAREIELVPTKAIYDIKKQADIIKGKLIDKPIMTGDIIDVNALHQSPMLNMRGASRRSTLGPLKLIVLNTNPDNEVVRFTRDTRIVFSNSQIRKKD